jgi:hypothetical protein
MNAMGKSQLVGLGSRSGERTFLAVDFEDVDGAIGVSQLLHRLLKRQVRVAFGATRVRVAAAQTPVGERRCSCSQHRCARCSPWPSRRHEFRTSPLPAPAPVRPRRRSCRCSQSSRRGTFREAGCCCYCSRPRILLRAGRRGGADRTPTWAHPRRSRPAVGRDT